MVIRVLISVFTTQKNGQKIMNNEKKPYAFSKLHGRKYMTFIPMALCRMYTEKFYFAQEKMLRNVIYFHRIFMADHQKLVAVFLQFEKFAQMSIKSAGIFVQEINFLQSQNFTVWYVLDW